MSQATVCSYYLQGNCYFGTNCQYLHPSNNQHNDFIPNNFPDNSLNTQQNYQPYNHLQHTYSNHFHHQNYFSPVYHQQRTIYTKNNFFLSNPSCNNSYYHPNHYQPKRFAHTRRGHKIPKKKLPPFKNVSIDTSKPCIICDIDGTLVDIEDRLALAPATRKDGSRLPNQWEIILKGENYFLDKPINVAHAYLKYLESLNKYNIIYLSGRRRDTISQTQKWLFKENDYPSGHIIHRWKGEDSKLFKETQLRRLNENYNVIAYFGDRLVDDCIYCLKANVRPILVIQNEWLTFEDIKYGMKHVVEKVKQKNQVLKEKNLRHVHDFFFEKIKTCDYYNMSYSDLIPYQFSSELYGFNGNVDDEDEMKKYFDNLPRVVQMKHVKKKGFKEEWNKMLVKSYSEYKKLKDSVESNPDENKEVADETEYKIDPSKNYFLQDSL